MGKPLETANNNPPSKSKYLKINLTFYREEWLFPPLYSGSNLNQYGVASPCRTICTVCGFVVLSRFLLIHYICLED